MSKRITWAIASAAVVASIAVSGTALASGSHAKHHAARISHAALSTTAPEPVDASDASDAASAASDPVGPNDQASGPDPAGAAQTGTSGEQSSSELVAGDGPGGHADEPGNANADHQFQGEE